MTPAEVDSGTAAEPWRSVPGAMSRLHVDVVRSFTAAAVALLAVLSMGCSGDDSDSETRVVPSGDPAAGQAVLTELPCGSCHTIPGVAGADATIGGSLAAWSEREMVAGVLPNNPQNLAAFIENPQKFVPGIAMPRVAFSEGQVDDIVAYLFSLE